MNPDWTIANLAIQSVAGVLGAHAAASAAHEHRFGFVGHSLVGLVAGAVSGYFLQEIVNTTGSGETMPASAVETAIIQALAGAVIGAIVMLAIGFMRSETTRKPN
jgi:uncharacterized membrane protein YeaQ/YmgE (transglycosylase-associated protein family)